MQSSLCPGLSQYAQEFSEFAQRCDKECGRTPLELPFAIEGDCVGDQSIKFSGLFSNPKNWTVGLQRMLADLKWALAWMVAAQNDLAGSRRQG